MTQVESSREQNMELNDPIQPLKRGAYKARDGRYWLLSSVRSSGHVKICEITKDMQGITEPYMALSSEVERTLNEGGDVPMWSRSQQMIVTLDTLTHLPSWSSVSALCETARIPSSTIRALLKRRRDGQHVELSLQQSKALERGLREMAESLHRVLQTNSD